MQYSNGSVPRFSSHVGPKKPVIWGAQSWPSPFFRNLLPLFLLALTTACKRPDPIRLEATIEEPPALASTVRVADLSTSSQLIHGFYELTNNNWRWAAPKFSVVLQTPTTAYSNGAWLVLSFTLPETSIDTLKNITVVAKVGQAALTPETFATPGEHTYRHEAPGAAFTKDLVYTEFTVDKFLKPANDGRDLALIVTAVGLDPK